MIQFIACSVTPAKVDQLRASLHNAMASEPWKLSVIWDAKSLSEGFNRGIVNRDPTADVIVLLHDDVWFLGENLGVHFREALRQTDIVGVSGTRKVTSMAWASSDHPHIFGTFLHPTSTGTINLHVVAVQDWETHQMQSLDGCILVCRPTVFNVLSFDEVVFDGWHGYDADFTYRAYLSGLRLAVSSRFLMVHMSEGVYTSDDWREYRDRFDVKHRLIIQPSGWSGILSTQRALVIERLVAQWPNVLPKLQQATHFNRERFSRYQSIHRHSLSQSIGHVVAV